MSAKNLKLTLEGLQFPDFGNDGSKKNFRLIFTFRCIDADGKPGTVVASLPPLTKDNWQWRKKDKGNYVSNDGKGLIHVDQIPKDERLILWEKNNIHSLDLKVVDIEDKNVWDYVKATLLELEKIGVGVVEGSLSGVFLRLFKPISAEAQKKVEELLNKLTNDGDKTLYRDEVEADDGLIFLNEGEYVMAGKGVLEKTNDKQGDYSVKVKLRFIEV